MRCGVCRLLFYPREPFLAYTDVYGVTNNYHVGCWNNSIYGEAGRRKEN